MSPNYIKCGTSNSPYLSTELQDGGFFGNKNGDMRAFIGVYNAGYGMMYLYNSSGSTTITADGSNGYIYNDGQIISDGGIYSKDSVNAQSGSTITCWLEGSTGEVCGSQFVPTSVVEKKENIEDFSDALSLVENTDIYKYDLKIESGLENRKKHYGAIIGEGYNCIEEIISNGKDGNPIGVDLYSMVSILWKSVQELSAEVDDLKTQLEEANK